jgi:tryptophanyl-tRNA synthetase
VSCKNNCADKISEYLAPIQERRRKFSDDLDNVQDILNDGIMRARKEAEITMGRVREVMGMG